MLDFFADDHARLERTRDRLREAETRAEEAERRWRQARRQRRPSLLGDMVSGTVAGALAVYVTQKVDGTLFAAAPDAPLRPLAGRSDGADPGQVLAQRTARKLGFRLAPNDLQRWGVVAHYVLGAVPGAVYNVLRQRIGLIDAAHGVVFGLSSFVVKDEILHEPATPDTKQPADPWTAHARGVVGHVVHGLVTEAVLRVLSPRHHEHDDEA